MSNGQLDWNALEQMFWEIADRLDDNESYTLFVAGGGALILCYNMSFSTDDFDSFDWYGTLPVNVRNAAEEVAYEYGAASDWLNNSLTQCIEYGDVCDLEFLINNANYNYAREYVNRNGHTTLKIIPVSLEGILLCKLEASRDKDYPHMYAICNALGLRTYDDIIETVKAIEPDIENRYHWNIISSTAQRLMP